MGPEGGPNFALFSFPPTISCSRRWANQNARPLFPPMLCFGGISLLCFYPLWCLAAFGSHFPEVVLAVILFSLFWSPSCFCHVGPFFSRRFLFFLSINYTTASKPQTLKPNPSVSAFIAAHSACLADATPRSASAVGEWSIHLQMTDFGAVVFAATMNARGVPQDFWYFAG